LEQKNYEHNSLKEIKELNINFEENKKEKKRKFKGKK